MLSGAGQRWYSKYLITGPLWTQNERTLAQSEWMPAINNDMPMPTCPSWISAPAQLQKANQETQSNLCLVLNLLRPDSAHNVPLLKVLALPSEAMPSISLNWISGWFKSKDSARSCQLIHWSAINVAELVVVLNCSLFFFNWKSNTWSWYKNTNS